MDINNIELPAFAVADLYHSTLVGETTTVPEKKAGSEKIEASIDPVSTPENDPVWRSLGNNQKNILIIVNNSDAVHLPEAELEFLTGILGACKLTLADVAIVNINEQAATYKELTSHFKSRIVFLFDVAPASFGLPMNLPHYQIQAFANNSFIYSPSLKALENDRVEKSKLWVSLKRLFNL